MLSFFVWLRPRYFSCLLDTFFQIVLTSLTVRVTTGRYSRVYFPILIGHALCSPTLQRPRKFDFSPVPLLVVKLTLIPLLFSLRRPPFPFLLRSVSFGILRSRGFETPTVHFFFFFFPPDASPRAFGRMSRERVRAGPPPIPIPPSSPCVDPSSLLFQLISLLVPPLPLVAS